MHQTLALTHKIKTNTGSKRKSTLRKIHEITDKLTSLLALNK